MKIKNIDWDADSEDVLSLPTEVNVPECIPEEDIADYLSDTYEFCVKSFEMKH
ncbi:hypothetical protein [Konateibacter massiliensis]|uniref:hypothetical protein n=1 Tax=Konateibacter massiliensis TaxID=2002841 RepID=UPI0015D4E74D|nr:hypothetical protein [Konateibacter massiliensis]